jgi:hypothetical protein
MNEETLKGLLRELDELRGKVARLQAQEQGTGGGGGGAVTSVSANASDDVAVSPTTGAVLVSHKNSGVTAGTFNLITVNARGHATFGQLIAYLTGANSPLSVSGGVVSHDNSGVTAGTYNQLTVDGRGHATAGANIFYLTGANSPLNLSGSVVGHATSGVTAGSYTNANLTVNAFGHLTAVSNGSAAAGAVLLNSGGTHQTGADVRLENSTNGATMWVKNTWSFTTASKAIYAEAVEGSAIAAVSSKIAVNAVSSNDVALYASTVNGSSIAQFVGGATGSGQVLVLADGAIISTSYLDAQTNVRLNGLRFLERGSSFPVGPTNGQQIYRSDLYSTAERDTQFTGPGAAWFATDQGRVLLDNFNRANDAAFPGAPQIARQGYHPVAGTWGITGNQLYSASDTNADLLLTEAWSHELYLQCQMSGAINGANFRVPTLVFLGLDANNYIYVDLYNGGARLIKIDGGAVSVLATSGAFTTTDGTTYTVLITVSGISINVYVDNTLRITHPLAAANHKYLQYNRVGFRLSKGGTPVTAARWDNLIARQRINA